jgi:hypothetical protein
MSYYYSSQSGLYLQNQSGSNLVNLITKGFNTDFLPLTLDKLNNRVGINNTTPQHTLDVNGDIRANSISFATDCYLRKSENDDMIINIPQEKTFALYENGLNLLDANSNMTNIYTKANFYNHVGIMTPPNSNFALSVNGLLNCQDALIYNNITANSATFSNNINTNTLNVIDSLTVANNITVDKVFTNLLECNGNITSSALIKTNQFETNFIYSKQGALIEGEVTVSDFTAKNYLASEKTGSVFAYTLNFTTVFDIVKGNIVGIPGEPGSELNHVNLFDTIYADGSPYVASYGDVADNLAYGTELVTRSGVVEEQTRLFEINRALREKLQVTKCRFIFRLLHFDTINNPVTSVGSGLTFDNIYESYLVVFLRINDAYYNVKNEYDNKRTIFKIRSYPGKGYSTCYSPWLLYDPTSFPYNRNDNRSYTFGLPYGNAIRIGSVSCQFK